MAFVILIGFVIVVALMVLRIEASKPATKLTPAEEAAYERTPS